MNPAAEAFRNFDTDPGTGLISSLSLDNQDDSRRGAASRANSVRFDESANNHYGSSRQSIELPTRTGSGLGSHPLSERSLSHRSDGRASTSGFAVRTNSFGLEQSRLLGSIHNSPKVSAHPAPGFFVLAPCPSIIRCWLTDTFSNESLLYAAICSGSARSSVDASLVNKLGLSAAVVADEDDARLRSIKLPVYLTEAKVQYPASRSASPAPQVPTLLVTFLVNDLPAEDRSMPVVLGSDVLRSHNADVLFSQDKLVIFDEERNQLSIPLVRPEDDAVYKDLCTTSRRHLLPSDAAHHPETMVPGGPSAPGIIGRPGKTGREGQTSPPAASPSIMTSAVPSDPGDFHRTEQSTQASTRSSIDFTPLRPNEDSKSTTGSEKSFTTPMSKSNSGVWGASWRSTTSTEASTTTAASKLASTYAKPNVPRTMKVLRPGKSAVGSISRTPSSSSPFANGAENASPKPGESEQKTSEAKTTPSATSKTNPIGSGSAFGWLNPGQQGKTAANGS